ncbi:MAG: amidohydrolase family protein [Bacteroidetes bacterium]|nr:amidohydrolase family protein [Bacteroidota bacterium]MCL5737250.1 amidohydrolase family protein [Bacteroidota bacterium]
MNSTKIITGAFCFTCNDEKWTGFFNIATRSNLIVELSKDIEVLKRKYPEAEIVDAAGKIVLPTFFNAHFHPEAIICRSVEPRKPISQWQEKSLLRVEAALEAQDENFYEKLYHLAFFSGLQSGVGGIAFAVIGDEAGARGMYSAVKLTGVDVVAFAKGEQQSSFLRRVVDRHLKTGNFVPYQKDLTLFGLSAVARSNSDSPGWIMTHTDEDEEDILTTKSNFNSDLIQLLKKSGLLSSATVLVGLNGTPVNSLKAAKAGGARIVLIPGKLNQPNFKSIRNIFYEYAIGSDWETPGIFAQMKKLLEFDCEPEEVLASATRVGAEMFNLSSKLGSIEVGKVANLTFVDARKLSARRLEKLPTSESAGAFIEDYTDSDVSDVMLDGEFVYRDRKLLLYHDAELLNEEIELVEALKKYEQNTILVSEGKLSSPRIPETRAERPSEIEAESQKIKLPKVIRKVFGEDEF